MRAVSLITLVWLAAAPAAAQDILVTVNSFEGRTMSFDLVDLSMVSSSPISRSECDAGALINFRFSQVDQTRAQLHLFHGSSCNDSSIRNDTTDLSCTDLELEYAISMRTEVIQDIAVSSLIDCSSTSSGTRTVWVLALDEPVSDTALAGQQVSFPLAFDFAGPTAPVGFITRDGETEGTLTWDGSTEDVETYEVYFVENGCDGAGTVTTDAFADPANPTVAADHSVTGTETTSTVSFAAVGSGTQHAVAVRAIDNAGNIGGLSDVLCVTQIDVNTFWDSFCGTEGHPACSGGGCSAAPVSTRPPSNGPSVSGVSSLAGLAFFALGLLVWRRRSRT